MPKNEEQRVCAFFNKNQHSQGKFVYFVIKYFKKFSYQIIKFSPKVLFVCKIIFRKIQIITYCQILAILMDP